MTAFRADSLRCSGAIAAALAGPPFLPPFLPSFDMVMSRNHLRVWKSPYEVQGRPLWCIAATHDIGFERDQRNNGVTHKIDPAIDGEREFVNDTLSGTGLVIARDRVMPPNPLTEAKTATGGTFHSDGRIVVLVLKPGAPSASAGASN